MHADMPTAWRLVRRKHARTALDGSGARLSGGRFNSEGVAVVYAADMLALALVEIAVHVPSYRGLRDRVAFALTFADDLIERLPEEALPDDWRSVPPSRSTQHLGDAWVREGRSAVLQVPSVVVPHHSNFILNSAHPNFERIVAGTPEPVPIDPRLIKGPQRA